ncbi:MAG: dinitrogenase iron-molybdenum cofactor biosynthesis protein [Salinivirgaceae bacterium]|nr:dinitrogenase iron-molybdenum cofactor biosynthesis protein [Salinivirgaceae bacterium]
MLTVITATNSNVNAEFDLRFGRGAYFCVFNEENGDIKFVENEFKDAQGGAGTKAAEKMVELGVKKIISGDFGPKAKEMLEKFKIQMVIIQDGNSSVQQIIDKIKN